MKSKDYSFKKIDAFATAGSEGNPAGTIWLNSKEEIDHEGMLQIARELKGFVSEVGFIHKLDEELFGVKYYSSEREVNFCGHATIALMYELFSSDERISGKETITILTNDGPLEVENRIASDNAVFIMSPEPIFSSKKPETDKIARKLRIDESEINHRLPIKIVDAGLRTLLVPINTLESILAINPDLLELKAFCEESHVDIIEVFTEQTSLRDNDFRVRVFAPTFGYLEDPATGSGNSALGYYLLENQMWKRDTLVLEQNNSKENYNIIKLHQKADSKCNTRVVFGGGANKRIEGTYTLIPRA